MRVAPNGSASPSVRSARIRPLYRPPWTTIPSFSVPGEHLVQAFLGDELARRRQPHLGLELLLPEGRRRVREAVVDEFARRTVETLARRDRGRHVRSCLERTAHMAGADPQLHHHRRIRGLGELEAALHHVGDGGEVRPRVEKPHQRFQREGVAALLGDHAAFAVVLAEHDQRAAHHAGAREIGSASAATLVPTIDFQVTAPRAGS